MSSDPTRSFDYAKLRAGVRTELSATVVVEEPLEVRLNGAPVAVTMRTPGHDVELALGFLFSEGVVRDPGAIVTAAHCDDAGNVIDVATEPGASGVHLPAERNFFASSSCGVCGKATIEAVRREQPALDDPMRVKPRLLSALAERLRELQPVFRKTGSLHAAALFTPQGELVCAREDVGRHNAVDKIIGHALLEGNLPLDGHVLMVSARCGFEIVQKALAARVPLLCAVSGPSSLAIELAAEGGMTLVGFLRGDEMNVYCGVERVLSD